MKILVTGASGFLGGKLLPQLTKKHEVRGFDAKPSELSEVFLTAGDIRDFDSLRDALDGIEAVVHFAAMTAKPSANDPLLAYDVNVKGTYNLAQAAVCAGVKKIVFASTIGVVGCLSEGFVPECVPVDESHPCLAKDTYGLTKHLGEEILKGYCRKHDLATVCLRFNWVQDTRAEGASPGGQKTMWSTVDYRDVIQAIILSLESDIAGNEIINIASENNWFGVNSLDLVRRHFQSTAINSTYFAENPKRGIFSILKARAVLNYQPRYEAENKGICQD